ncbi:MULTISPECIES: GNAT family N-acetyltransferase [Actinoalloteichus]|uniref:Acetyltransferase, ribosomal protein N-acetylase n=1 Tax=Actinoalloteichus fjordicus TaxID=1612552 RepID=A0AAC9LCI4_9PSEU|nr:MULTISPECIES: GNAT family N-acetyltransferase [Actinoalloteichus]APU15072.1 acetyltransferase, ribosomal protein N-acetylase [Actinoalloteichus fjordicus]APU21140.1 acetyltransferase, ribosomal protein N-acetylase [Actinoalloteichus sp. GBA129-24]
MPTDALSWVGRKVRLRQIVPADRRTLTGFDRDSTRSPASQIGGYRHWAEHRTAPSDSGDDFRFAIETLYGRMLVGSMSAVQTDAASGRFSYGIGIGTAHRRCGYAGDAITVLLNFMFGRRRYQKCEVSIYGGNLASLSLHSGLGFREEGRPRDTELLRGEVKYPVLMGITAHEFAVRHPHGTTSAPSDQSRRGRHSRTRRRGRHWRGQDSG